MSEIITISNDYVTAQISTLGAELISLKKGENEYIWCGNPDIWKGHSPILFPICSCIKEDTFIYRDKQYNLMRHGFAKTSEFEIVKKDKSSATFLLTSNAQTKSVYPFDFELRVNYVLSGEKLGVYYIVNNLSSEAMYFNVGCHEAYALAGDMNRYSLKFYNANKLDCTIFHDSLMQDEKFEIALNDGEFPLSMDCFTGMQKFSKGETKKDSLIIENIECKRVGLLKDGVEILTVYFNDFDHLVLWTKNPGFIAIEPWDGMPDFFDTNQKLENKKYITKIERGEGKIFYHSITLN